MGNEFSAPRHVLERQLHDGKALLLQQRKRDQELFRALDAQTKVPHLLVELRSLGFIEVCGKDLGGIYARLGEWLKATWGCEAATKEAREGIYSGLCGCVCWYSVFFNDCCCTLPCSDYIFCGCAPPCCECGGTLVLMDGQPIEDYDRLCDANYAVPTPELGCCCRNVSLCECDRHYPVCCWYCSRYCCAAKAAKQKVFRRRGFSGESNMGKLTMQLVDFMTNECGWSLVLCNGTNLGWYGDIREQQIKFAAPSALNLIAPHIMIELRTVGYIEVNGRDTDGIYATLAAWFREQWRARPTRADPKFCDLKFRCSAFKRRGFEGENNLGQCTMQLVDYLTLQCAWTLVTCNGGNFGMRGDWREQQLVFRKDSHVQHGSDHVMVELRDVLNSGYIEVNGIKTSPCIKDPLHDFIMSKWGCKEFAWGRKEPFCDQKYSTPKQFYYRAPKLTNNLGKRTIELATFMASQGWLLMLCNGGAITNMRGIENRLNARSADFQVGREFEGQINREQQIKFTKARPGEKTTGSLLMIELRAVPRDPDVENVPWCIGQRCEGFDEPKSERERKDWEWGFQAAARRLTRREEVRNWLRSDYRIEQKNRSKGPMDRQSALFGPYLEPEWRAAARTAGSPCGIFEGIIEVNGPDTNHVYRQIERFIQTQMRGSRVRGPHSYCDALFSCNTFRMKRVPFPDTNPEVDGYYLGENNIGIYTMRLCDFLVDHIGEWDLIVCNGNALERAWKVDRDRAVSVVSREQQLVFRHRGARRNVFMAVQPVGGPSLGRPPLQAPEYWSEETREGRVAQKLVPASPQELECLQELLDRTFVNKTTRDGKGRELAKRFIAVQAMRSEHPALWDRFAQRRAEVAAARGQEQFESAAVPKTMSHAASLTGRCKDSEGANGANEALLFHGTNPSGALSILGTSFKVDAAGLAAGTMFGPGVYLAESSSKSDEYAQDDPEGSNKGLFALLLCRAVVGKPFIVEKPGNYAEKATSAEFDSVLGDREKAVGTYREFIFFHEASIYPEFVLYYRRDDGKKAEDSAGPPSTALCKYFARGYCKHGNRCRFAHPASAPAGPAATMVGAPLQHTMGSSPP